MRNVVTQFFRNDGGQDLIEYALLGTLIALAVIGGVQALGQALSTSYTGINSKFVAGAAS